MTTLKQGAQAMGSEAISLLIKQIESPRTFLPKKITIPGELVKGETVKRIDS